MIDIRFGEVHLWWAIPGRSHEPRVVERQLRVLSSLELEKYHRFAFETHRRLYRVSHALVRHVLSQYAHTAPEDWCFRTNAYGKPFIDHADIGNWLQFNFVAH